MNLGQGEDQTRLEEMAKAGRGRERQRQGQGGKVNNGGPPTL